MFNQNWLTPEGNHDGGVSFGFGYAIAWQRGPVQEEEDRDIEAGQVPKNNGRNGAFLIEVLKACRHQLSIYQNGKFACEENDKALSALDACIELLEMRRDRRKEEGKLGTTQV
jgi:hypothetical protein